MILFLGGDGEMKTRVMNVLSTEALPSTAWDGTIALISPLDVGRVYVDMSVPDAPNVGDVQIRPNLSSSYVYEIGDVAVPYADIHQYDGSSWKKMTYYRYDGIAWQPGRVYLLDGADETVLWNTYAWYGASVEKTEDGFEIFGTNSGNQPGAIQTAQRLDLTGFSNLRCIGHNDTVVGGQYLFRVGIQASQVYAGDAYEGTEIIQNSAVSEVYGDTGSFDLTVDILDYNGDYYIGCLSGHENTQIYQIWLEV